GAVPAWSGACWGVVLGSGSSPGSMVAGRCELASREASTANSGTSSNSEVMARLRLRGSTDIAHAAVDGWGMTPPRWEWLATGHLLVANPPAYRPPPPARSIPGPPSRQPGARPDGPSIE